MNGLMEPQVRHQGLVGLLFFDGDDRVAHHKPQTSAWSQTPHFSGAQGGPMSTLPCKAADGTPCETRTNPKPETS